MTLTGIGAHRPDNPRGWLVFSHLPGSLQQLEDATQAADAEYARLVQLRDGWKRLATPTERALLTHVLSDRGVTLPSELWTHISYTRGGGVRTRRWPQLEAQLDRLGATNGDNA